MRITGFLAALTAVAGLSGAAQAAVVNGTFTVNVVNVENVTGSQSQASVGNFDDANNGNFGTASTVGSYTYMGNLDFNNANSLTNPTTVLGFLQSAGGAVSGSTNLALDSKRLSKGKVNKGTATTTFFQFVAQSNYAAGSFTVKHDDGVAIFENGFTDAGRIGGNLGPTTLKTTLVPNYQGGDLTILYVATNDNPSILNVDLQANANVGEVPLPAPAALLAAGIAGLGFFRRKAA